jgi:hypothetical protein
MRKAESLRRQQEAIKNEIAQNLDLLAGSIAKSPSMSGHSLTTKREGKTVTVYVRKEILQRAQAMTERHRKVKDLILRLSKVNWELLRLESE